MVTWAEFTAEVPELAAYVEERFRARKFLVMATIRADGSPRVCGTEVMFRDDGLWLGGMKDARRWDDLRRDPRLAIHCGQDDEASWRGDAKVAGTAVPVTDPAVLRTFSDSGEVPEMELFRVDVTEASSVRLDGDPPDAIVVSSWHPGTGVKSVRRD